MDTITGILIIEPEKNVFFLVEDWKSANNATNVYFARKGFVVEDYFAINQQKRYYISEKHDIRSIPIEDPKDNNVCKMSIAGDCSSTSLMLDILKDIVTMLKNRYMIVNGKLLIRDRVVYIIDSEITTTTAKFI